MCYGTLSPAMFTLELADDCGLVDKVVKALSPRQRLKSTNKLVPTEKMKQLMHTLVGLTTIYNKDRNDTLKTCRNSPGVEWALL